MGGISSYFNPTSPYQGFSNLRPKFITNMARSLQFGKSVKGLAEANTAGAKLRGASNVYSNYKGLQYAGLIPGHDPKFRMAKTPNPKAVVRGQFQQERENAKSFQEKFKNRREAMALLTPNTIEKMKNKKNNKPKLAPIVPKGEFAKLFGPLMIEYRIEEVNRDNFFNTFIQAIEGKNYESRNDINEINIRKFLIKFKEILISHSLTYKQKETLRNINIQIKKLEKFFENVQNKEDYNNSDPYVIKLKNLKQNKARIESLLNEISEYIKTKNFDKLSEKLVIKKENITNIRIFIEENIEKWKSAINEKIKEYTRIINEYKESLITPEQKKNQKIQHLIGYYKNLFQYISQLLYKINDNEDLEKIIRMAFILNKLIDDTGPTNQYNITKTLTDIENGVKAKYKYPNKTSNFNKLKIFSKIPDQIRDEIKVLNISELQKKLNELFIELYTKYEPSINKNSIPQIKETVNSINKYGTIEYKDLSEKIKSIFSGISKSSNLEDLIIFLELKIVVDKFFELIGGTNYEVKKYNLFSSKIDMDLSQKIKKSKLKNNSNRITKEITKKTIEELKMKANELIQRLSKYLSNNNNSRSIPVTISENQNQSRINNNSRSIASTISGNQNQSRINNSELKPFKNISVP